MSFAILSRVGLRIRLLALFLAIFGGIFVSFSYFLYRQMINDHQEEFDTFLYNYAIDVARSIEVDLFGDINVRPNIFFESEKVFPFALGETYIQVHNRVTGRLVAKSSSLRAHALPYFPNAFKEGAREGAIFRRLSEEDSKAAGLRPGVYRLIDYYIDKPGPWDFVLQVAVPMGLIEKEKKDYRAFFLIGIPILLILATMGGWFLSGRALKPINEIIRTSRSLTAQQLSARVPVPESRDEVRLLVETLNDLFNRLESAFRSQETFIADASHQLKTPLAVLRGEIDLMLSKDRSPEEVREFLSVTSQEVDYLNRIVEDLLIIARVDAAKSFLAWEWVRLDESLLDVTARLERPAASKNIKMHVRLDEEPAEAGDFRSFEVRGDADLLRSLIENFVANAIKYSPAGSSVSLRLVDEGPRLRLTVSDQGPGIASEDQSRIFERFFRAEGGRGKVAGSGLGLPIAKKIADLHGAELSVESEPGRGAVFQVIFKKS